MRKDFFDQFGKLLGHTEKIGNNTHIFDSMGRLLGKHDPVSDQVFDNMGRLVGKGIELLGTLLKK